MKTAVSLPDELFEEAEAAAARMHVTRSRLYAEALRLFLERQREQSITDQINKVLETESSELDPVLEEMQARSVPAEEW